MNTHILLAAVLALIIMVVLAPELVCLVIFMLRKLGCFGPDLRPLDFRLPFLKLGIVLDPRPKPGKPAVEANDGRRERAWYPSVPGAWFPPKRRRKSWWRRAKSH